MNFIKKNKIRFQGTKETETHLKNSPDNTISRRFKILLGLIIIMGIVLLLRLYTIQIGQRDYYDSKLMQYNTTVFTNDTFRGSIYDRNYSRLVYNKNINCATYYAVKNIKDEDIQVIVNFLINNIKVDTSDIKSRDKKDYLMKKDPDYVDSLLTEDELKLEDSVVYKLKLDRLTDDILDKKLTENDIKYYMLYFKIINCRVGSTVLLEGLTIKEASIIGENANLLKGIRVTNDWAREYVYKENFTQVLGKVTTKKQGLPANLKDVLLAKDYNNDARVGVSGLEAQYEEILNGSSSKYSMSYDANGLPLIQTISSGSKGNDMRITIDWELQEALSKEAEKLLKAKSAGPKNNHIFLTLINPNNGEIIAMVGKQRDPKTGKITDFAAGNYLYAYEIGSTFKGATIYTGFKENIITENTYFDDTSAGIKIKGTPVKKSWNKSGLGRLNEIEALSMSSNVYMFYIAMKLGGGTYKYDQPLTVDSKAFDTLRRDVGELGLGVKTGLDIPKEELGYRGKVTERQGGNLLDFSIGQYDTYTPIQMAQYISTIANGGKRVQPHFFMDSFTENDDGEKITLLEHQLKVLDDVSSYKMAFRQIQKGFRAGCVTGLAKAVNGPYQSAGKTGTAQVVIGGVEYQNRAFVGYAPYDSPEIAVSCLSEAQTPKSTSLCSGLSKSAFTKYFEKYPLKK